MQSMYGILKKLEDTSGTNDKIALLKSLKSNPDLESLFKKAARYAYDPSYDFHVKEFETSDHPGQPLTPMDLEEALNGLEDYLDSRKLTGHAAKHWVEDTYRSLDIKDAEVFKRVVKRDLRCKVSVKTINKVWPELIYEHPYMRCESFKEKNLKNISYPCFSQTKMDGLYVDIIIEMTQVTYRTRNGSYLNVNEPERDKVLIEKLAPCVLQGEALALDAEGTIMERASSNGYLNSNDIDPDRVVFYVWDTISISDFKAWKSNETYKHRYQVMQRCIAVCNVDWLREIDTIVCNTSDDVLEHFMQKRKEGEEGTVIKDYKGKWKSGTSKHQVKIKVIFDCELKVIGYKEGKNKFVGQLGAILCASSDGVIEVSVGGGFSEKQRQTLYSEMDSWIESGQIVTVRANDISKTENGTSLFLPRFVERRFDKNEADSSEKVYDQLYSCLNVLKAIGDQ